MVYVQETIGYVYMRRTCFAVLLLCLLPIVGGCATPVNPRYQPMVKGRSGSLPPQGYFDFKIDEQTYLVTYQGFNSVEAGIWNRLSHDEWVEMVQEFVPYLMEYFRKSR